MARLRCLNCGSMLDKKALTAYSVTGATKVGVGFGRTLLIWPFTLRIYAECPNCKQKSWLKVLSPWSKS